MFVADVRTTNMKRKFLTPNLKRAIVAVPAAALMLGAAQAGTTIGLNFQTWTYANGGAGYQTTGFPVTAKAFGVDVGQWVNTAPLYAYAAVSTSVAMGSITAQLEATNPWQTGIGALNAGWVPEVVTPGDDEVTWGMLDNTGWSVGLTGLNAPFPSGYVVFNIAAGKVTADSRVAVTDSTTFTNWAGFDRIYTAGVGTYGTGPVGLQTTPVLTANAITMSSPSRTGGNSNNCALAGFIITDQPVVCQKPVGGTYNSGASITMSGSAIGIPPLGYQWTHAGTNLPGATSTSYTIPSARPADAGDYTLVATNQYGAGTSVVASVTVVMVPTIQTDIRSRTNYATLTQGFTVVAGGAEPLAYQWTHAGTNLPAGTAATLLLSNLQAADAGDYQVIVTNSLGAATSSVATLTLVSSLPYDGFSYTDGELTGQNGGTGWTGPWTASGNGSNTVANPIPPYGYQDAADMLVVNGGSVALGTSGSADFNNARLLAGTVGGAGTVYLSFLGQFSAGGWGGIWLQSGGLDQIFLGQGWYNSPWGFGSFPYPEHLSSKASTALSFVVCRFDYTTTNVAVRMYVNPTLATEPATADATGTVSWFTFDGLRFAAHASMSGVLDEIRIGGTWASAVASTPRTDPPVFVKDLPGTTSYAYAGGSATMSVLAQGAPTLHYVWKKNSTTVVGTDSPTLTLASVTTANSGSYTVTVSNNYGTTNSVAQQLTVATPPDLVSSRMAADAPMAFWPLNETVAPTAYDYSGGGRDGTQNGGLTPDVAGPRPPACQGFGSTTRAYQFDGFSGYIDFGKAASLGGTTDFTVEAWINTTNNATEDIFSQRDNNVYNGEYELKVNGAGAVTFYMYGAGGYQFNLSSSGKGPRVNDGRWHHVAGVRSGTNGTIYIDGSAVVTGSSSTTLRPLDANGSLSLGVNLRGMNSYFVGSICDAALYNYALSPARIRDHAVTGVLASSPLRITAVPGGWVEDSKPSGTPHPGKNLGASWVASSTDLAVPAVTRTGVAQFSGGSQIAIPPSTDLNSPAGTICFWMLATAPFPGDGNEAAILLDHRTSTGAVIAMDDAGSIFWQGQGGSQNSVAGGYLPDGNWHHVAVTYGQTINDTIGIYVDGNLVVSTTVTNGWSWPATQQIELGRSHDTYWKLYTGLMDDFRIYSRVLTPAEITTIATPASSDTLVDTATLQVRFNFGTAAGVGTSLSWPVGALQSSPTLGPEVWTRLDATSPYPFMAPAPATPANAPLFYSIGF